jgi:hypothetical protein
LSRHQIDRRVLAPAIDLKVELKLVTLVQLAHARTLDRADVHKGIRLAIIARYKAEALHCVEELDRAGRLVAGQLTLGCSRLGRNSNHIAHDLKIGSRNLAAAIDEVELKLLAFGEAFEARTLDRADVDEHVLTAVFALDEAEALLGIEELDDTLAGADHLGRHAATAATTAAAGAAEAATTAAARATKAAAITAAEAAATTASAAAKAATITAAKAAATATTAAETATIKTAAAETTAAVGVESAFVTETIALVASATPPPSVKTHKNQ